MVQMWQKDKEKVYEAIRTEKIDAAEISFPNLINHVLINNRGFLSQEMANYFPAQDIVPVLPKSAVLKLLFYLHLSLFATLLPPLLKVFDFL